MHFATDVSKAAFSSCVALVQRTGQVLYISKLFSKPRQAPRSVLNWSNVAVLSAILTFFWSRSRRIALEFVIGISLTFCIFLSFCCVLPSTNLFRAECQAFESILKAGWAPCRFPVKHDKLRDSPKQGPRVQDSKSNQRQLGIHRGFISLADCQPHLELARPAIASHPRPSMMVRRLAELAERRSTVSLKVSETLHQVRSVAMCCFLHTSRTQRSLPFVSPS